VCDLAGITPPPGLDARSFADVVEGKSDTARQAIFLAFMDFQRAVRAGDWKLIRYSQINFSQLFNLRDDPDEIHNLCDRHPAKERELMTLLAELQAANNDTLPLSSPHPHNSVVTAESLNQTPAK
jgi:arylsulfatase A-like enzyme